MKWYLGFILLIIVYCCFGISFKDLDDSILFNVNWPGYGIKSELVDSQDYEKLTLMTSDQQEFQCFFPLSYGQIENAGADYDGPGPLSILMPTLKKHFCTIKNDLYWSYKVCHGDVITQYHQERDSLATTKKKIDIQYVLGKITPEQLAQLEKEAKVEDSKVLKPSDIPQTMIEDTTLPYYAIDYMDGTECELTGRPRTTRALYVCYENSYDGIFTVQEISTCKYEIVLFNSELCKHPLYRKYKVPESQVHCRPTKPGLRRPLELVRIETESLGMRLMPEAELKTDSQEASVPLGKVDHIGIVVNQPDNNKVPSERKEATNKPPSAPKLLHPSDDSNPLEFLAGDTCLEGGSGFWRFLVCYGNYVEQFHVYNDDHRISIRLGSFNEGPHKEWIKKNPHKRPKKNKIYNYYNHGSYCEEIKADRTVEVEVKCPTRQVAPSAVVLSLFESSVCRYELVVESAAFCKYLPLADEYGRFPDKSIFTLHKKRDDILGESLSSDTTKVPPKSTSPSSGRKVSSQQKSSDVPKNKGDLPSGSKTRSGSSKP